MGRFLDNHIEAMRGTITYRAQITLNRDRHLFQKKRHLLRFFFLLPVFFGVALGKWKSLITKLLNSVSYHTERRSDDLHEPTCNFLSRRYVGGWCGTSPLNQSPRKRTRRRRRWWGRRRKRGEKRGGGGRVREEESNDTCNRALTSTFPADLREKHRSDKNARLLARQPADARRPVLAHIFRIIESSAPAVTTDINSNFLRRTKCFLEKYNAALYTHLVSRCGRASFPRARPCGRGKWSRR